MVNSRLSLPQESSGGKIHSKGANLMDRSNDRMAESDGETKSYHW